MDELQKILQSAESLFRKYGIRSVTMSDIANKIGISKKTLYIHVENKNDLIDKIVANYVEEEGKACLEICGSSIDALDEMLRISLHIQNNIEEMNPSLIFDLHKYHHNIWERFERFHKEVVLEMMRQNMERGIKEGLYRPDFSPEIVARIYISSVAMFSDDELFPIEHYPRPQLHKEFVNYHLYGIVSEKGRILLEKYLQKIHETLNSKTN